MGKIDKNENAVVFLLIKNENATKKANHEKIGSSIKNSIEPHIKKVENLSIRLFDVLRIM